ncbi:MAG: MFS transporter, partial [Candidatus Kariarchaeaceae archaeon]
AKPEEKVDDHQDGELEYLPLILLYIQSFIYLSLIYGIIITVGNYIIELQSDVSTSQIGITISAVSFTGFLVSLRYKNLRSSIGEYGIFTLIYIFLALGLILASFGQTYLAITLSMIVFAVGTGMNWPNSNLFVINRVPERYKGRAISMIYTFAFFGQFVAPFLTYPLVDQLGVAGFYRVAGFLYGIIGIGHLLLKLRS